MKHFGAGKEGMIITNENIILSKKLGGRSIPLSSVNQIHIKDKNLIINDIPVTKFNNPEVLPPHLAQNSMSSSQPQRILPIN
jgi:hypothetical protein